MKNHLSLLMFCLFLITTLVTGQGIPLIESVSPLSGAIGSSVTIRGMNFSAVPEDNHVFFGAVSAIVISSSATQLEVHVPVGATFQPITVSVNGLTAYSSAPFMVLFPFTGSIGGSFNNRVDLWAGYQTKGGTVADIDGDGKLDLIVVDQANNVVSIFRNVSTPGSLSWDSFEYKLDFPTGPGPYGLATGDLGGDGKLDLVITNAYTASISILQNTSVPGTVSFAAGVEFLSPSEPLSVAIKDLDLDGKADIAVTNSNTLSVFRNTSIGSSITSESFSERVDFAAGYNGIWSVVLQDVDGDGKPEMTVASGGDALVSIFRNISSPGSLTSSSFEPKVDLATGTYPAIVSLADLDGDLKPDLMVGNADGKTISLFRNTATPGIIDAASFAARVDLASGTGTWNPTAGDLDGDGKPDLVVRNTSDQTILIYKNKCAVGAISSDSFSPPYIVATGGASLSIVIADIDGDGKSDLTLSNEVTNVMSVFRNEDIFERSPLSHLTFTNITNTTLTAGFHASPDLPDGYIFVRRIGSAPSHPVNGVTYSIGQEIGEDVVAYIGSETSFEDSGLAPGVDYYYHGYAYDGAGVDIDYLTTRWATSVAFTIGIDQGPIISVSPATFTLDDEITIIFDATKSFPLNALVGATDIYLYSGIISESPESGNWNFNHTNYGYMTSLGDNKWSITFIPRYFYNYVPLDLTVHRLAMVFYDFQSHRGVSFDGKDIYLPVSPTVLNPPQALPATFASNTGFEAEWNGVEGVYEYHMDVSTSETFDSFVINYQDKVIYGSGAIRTTVAGLLPSTNYYYRIRRSSFSENSSTIRVTTLANPPVASPNVWVKTHGGPGTEEIQTMTSDDKGNIYAAGYFMGTITIGNTTLTSSGQADIFYVRYDPQGNVVWARSIGGSAYVLEVSLITDSKGLYMTAQFAYDIDLDPGPGIKQFWSAGEPWRNDGFFAQFNLKDGSLIWAHQLVDASTWSSSSIGVDHTGVYLAGRYNGTVDFDPGQGVALLTSQGDDVFMAKYSLRGKYIWATSLGGDSHDTAWGLLVDASGIYVTGHYNWGGDFDPTPEYYPLEGTGGFFGRYDLKTGKLIYVKNVGNGTIFSLDKHGHDLYIAGDFFGSIDADPGEGVEMIGTGDYTYHGLLGKYNLKDGTFRWANGLPTTDYVGLRKVIADGSGVYVSGYFGGSVDFASESAGAARTSGLADALSAYYNQDGSLEWAKGIGSPGGNAGSIAATLTRDGYYLGGSFTNTVNFDPYIEQVNRTSIEESPDIFIARYRLTRKFKKDFKDDRFAAGEDDEKEFIRLFPNPAEDRLMIDWKAIDNLAPFQVMILDLFGNPVMTRNMAAGEKSVDISNLAPGYHLFQIRQHNVVQTLRFFKK